MVRRRGRVPRQRRGRVVAGHERAVKPRHEAVVVAQPEREVLDRGHVRHHERHAHEGRGVAAQHPRAQIGAEGGRVIRARVEAHRRRACEPRGVVEARREPARADVVARHEDPHRCARGQERDRGVRHGEAVAHVAVLLRELGREGRSHRHAVSPHQREVLPVAIQAEARVQRRAGDAAILPVAEDHEEAVRRQVRGGERPLRQLAGVVREKPPAQVHRVRAGIVNLHPIRERVVLIGQRGAVDSHELREEQVVGSGQRHRSEEPEKHNAAECLHR